QYGGQPWEKGAFGVGVSNVHNVGDTLTWKVTIPAAGSYQVWLRYGHKMKDYQIADMGGRTAFGVDDQPLVPLENLPDTGGWNASAWARTAALQLPAGEHVLRWQNLKGGGLNLDAFALCTDPAWDPNAAVGDFTWWGGHRFTQPAAGEHHLLLQAEACSSFEGPEIQVGTGTPAGTKTHVAFAPGAIPAVAEPAGAEVHIFIAWGWVNAIVPVKRVDAERGLIEFAGEAAQDVRMGNRFYLENARELLDAPGEWFLDRPAGQLLYLPEQAGLQPEEVVAPVLDHLIALQGEPAQEQWVEHLHFRDLRFTDTSYTVTRDYYTPSDGAVRIGGARQVSLSGCEFAWLGGYGVHLEQRSHEVEIRRCHFHDLGQGGVHLVGGTAAQPHHCRVLGNTIERIGLIYKHVAGVYLTHGSDNRIAHNRITETPRYAISMKSQGEERLSHRNLVEYNELLRTNLETNDTGAIETLGYEHRDSGNVIRFNRIFDSVGLLTRPDGTIVTPHFTWGVYLDDYSSGTIVYGNIIGRTQLGGVCIHGGQNNVIENNILLDGHEHQVRLQPRDAFMQGNRFERNIVVWRRPESNLVYSYNDRRDVVSAWDRNVYWLAGADLTALTHRLTPLGPWSAWRGAGFDAHSVIADPRFEDPANDNYRLRPDSPALALGFQPIPIEKIGPEGLD
ncbi:MAG: right-handed parallel beta-helix repeat-containing protein, partial [Armatimonadetes bacterium]|nr:right-handed parallel beta-helix repeat-containing protein [Armatimonadota bacterium]